MYPWYHYLQCLWGVGNCDNHFAMLMQEMYS